jgi:hypothetical protein
VTKPLNTSPPTPTDGVDKLYHQLPEIHVIAAEELAECARWHQVGPTSNLAQARTSW